jgi:hypothetical protein
MTIGYTLGPNEGEHLVLRGGSIFIKAGPSTGSDGITMVTQQVLAGVTAKPHLPITPLHHIAITLRVTCDGMQETSGA